MGLGVTAIVLSLGLLMIVAYRGLPVIVFAPLLALLAVALSGLPLLPNFTESFMGQRGRLYQVLLPAVPAGRDLRQIDGDQRCGRLDRRDDACAPLGDRRAIAAVVLSCGILTYGGVSLFVVAFAVYPFAAVIFREAAIPKRLIPGAIPWAPSPLRWDALPGSPQIQNLIPTRYFGTDAYAGPVRRPRRRCGDLDRRADLARVPPGAGDRGRGGVWRPS